MNDNRIADPATQHRDTFHDRLDELEDLLVEGALLISAALPQVNEAYLDNREAIVRLCTSLCDRVRELVGQAEELGFILIAREGPVSGDLRRIVAVLRLVHDVDRSANLMRHVPESLELHDPRELPERTYELLTSLAHEATVVFTAGVEAYRQRDADALSRITERDLVVDDLAKRVLNGDVEFDPGAHMALGLVARYYERIADHGVAFARDTVFIVTGERPADHEVLPTISE